MLTLKISYESAYVVTKEAACVVTKEDVGASILALTPSLTLTATHSIAGETISITSLLADARVAFRIDEELTDCGVMLISLEPGEYEESFL